MYPLSSPSSLPPPLTPPKNIVHSHYFQFLLGITVIAREIEDTGYAKFLGVNKVHYGLGEKSEVWIFAQLLKWNNSINNNHYVPRAFLKNCTFDVFKSEKPSLGRLDK